MSDFDFDAAIAARLAQAGVDDTSEGTTGEVDEEVDEELEPVEDESDDTEEEEELEAEEGDEGALPSHLQAIVDRFGGIDKALQVAADSQEMISRQGNEIGDLRREMQQLRTDVHERPQPAPFYGNIEDRIATDPQSVAIWAIENNQPDVFQLAMDTWYEEEPRAATEFQGRLSEGRTRLAVQEEMERFRESIAPTIQPLQVQAQQRVLADAKAKLGAKYHDFDEILASARKEELEGLTGVDPVGDPGHALEAMYRWVKAGRIESAERAAAQTRSKTRAKKKAAVVEGSTSSAPEGEKGVLDRLREQMLTPEPHSVRHALRK